jgi:hypothetical protein
MLRLTLTNISVAGTGVLTPLGRLRRYQTASYTLTQAQFDAIKAQLDTLVGSSDITYTVSGLYAVTKGFADFQTAALTRDVTLFAPVAKVALQRVFVDVTAAFTGPTGPLTMTVGSTSGGAEIVASFDCQSAPVTKGLADADLGTGLVRAAAVQGIYLPSGGWTAGWTISSRITSASGDLSGLTTGSVTYYLDLAPLAPSVA